jgi:hypothetical protein
MTSTSLQRTLAALATSLLLAGCAGAPVNFTGRSVTDLSQIDTTKGERISAQGSGFQLLLLIPIGINGRQAAAYDALLEKAGDRVLSDITITESWKYGFVGTTYITTIEATAYSRVAKMAVK